MATYNGAMSVSGDSSYNSTAGGYQIAGGDASSAWATVTLPSTYTDYESCSISCVLYASTAPASWLSSWSCGLDIYKDGYELGSTQVIDRSVFGAGSGASSRTFNLNLSGGHLYAGDEIEIRFNGSDGGYVDSSSRCVYLRSAAFASNNAYKNIDLYFSANGGSGGPLAEQAQADSNGYATFTIPSAAPTRSGFAFLGWATTSGATTAAYTSGSTYQINTNKTLYAVWSANVNITLSFNANSGTGGPSAQTLLADSSGYASFTIPSSSPTRSNFTFLGWATTSGATTAAYTAGSTYRINTNKTLYAVWQAVTYTIQLLLYKGGDYSAWTDCTAIFRLYKSGELAAVFQPDPEVPHYRVSTPVAAGTYSLYMRSTDLNQTIEVTSTSTKVFPLRFRTVTYNANGATGGTLPVDANVYLTGSAATILQNSLSYPGYVFRGWNTAADGTGTAYAAGDSVTLTASPTLYAVWERSNAVNVYLDSTWKNSTAHVYTGESWEVPQAYVYDGTAWKNS